MATIGLIVEGIYDEAVYPVLLRRCRNGVRVVTRICKGPVIGKFPGLLSELDRSRRRIEKVIVVSDADGRNPEGLEREFKRRLVGRYRFNVIPIIVVEALEAWLIADPLALKRTVGITTAHTNPEKIRHPKTALLKLLPRTTRYTPEVARRIAEEIDLNLLQQRCRRFVTFRKAVFA
jgi:Domain of unknown function (DUF4276)